MGNNGAVKRWSEDLGAWFSSLRFSGFTVLVVVLLIAGSVIVSPSLSTYIQQQRELADLRESVQQAQDAVDKIDAERAKWRDPAYVRTQARDRLFYVLPGETQLNVIDDVALPTESTDTTDAKLSRIESKWAQKLAASFMQAGTTTAEPQDPTASQSGTENPADRQKTPSDDPTNTESSTTEDSE